MVTGMDIHHRVGHAGLAGWRKTVADLVAPRAAERGPVSEDQVRAFIGGAFFVLSVYYVAATIARALKDAD
jgi:hypothetical protein